MAEPVTNAFTTDSVISKLRALKMTYITEGVGKNPAELPNHFAEFLGWATFLYDFYADQIQRFEKLEARVMAEENEAMNQHNAGKEKRGDKMTIAEMQQRIDVRLADEKAKKKRLEQAVKGATLHINGCQSLMKNWGDEAKGVR